MSKEPPMGISGMEDVDISPFKRARRGSQWGWRLESPCMRMGDASIMCIAVLAGISE